MRSFCKAKPAIMQHIFPISACSRVTNGPTTTRACPSSQWTPFLMYSSWPWHEPNLLYEHALGHHYAFRNSFGHGHGHADRSPFGHFPQSVCSYKEGPECAMAMHFWCGHVTGHMRSVIYLQALYIQYLSIYRKMYHTSSRTFR